MKKTNNLNGKYSGEFAEDYSGNLLDDYKELLPELSDFKTTVDKAVENVIKGNPDFWGIPFEQLKSMTEFKQALKEYINKNNSSLSALEILKSVIPKKHVKPNNKLSNKITKDIVDEGEFDLIISGRKAKKEVTTKVMLEYDNKYLDFSGQKYTPYDREVYDGVVTLYAAGNNIVTPAMVYRAMNGLTETEYIKPETLEKVKESLDKSRYLRIIIDYTEEAKLYNKDIKKTKYEGYVLAANKITVNLNGQEHEAYKLLDKPILYEYAQISGQIISVPMKLLQTKDAVRSTDEVIVIRGYLLRQIEWIKNDKSNRSDNIAYQSIYNELKILKFDLGEQAYKDKTKKIRNHVKAVLDEWVEEGYILKYAEYKEGRTIIGVTIAIV